MSNKNNDDKKAEKAAAKKAAADKKAAAKKAKADKKNAVKTTTKKPAEIKPPVQTKGPDPLDHDNPLRPLHGDSQEALGQKIIQEAMAVTMRGKRSFAHLQDLCKAYEKGAQVEQAASA